jgi:hypothetical protein
MAMPATQMEVRVPMPPRLRPPTPKVAIRLEREAIEAVATESRDSFDRVEDIYQKSRSTLAHLRHQAKEPTHFPDLRTKVQELVAKSDEFLAEAERTGYGTAAWRAEIDRLAKKISLSLEDARVETLVIPAEIEMFLKVVDTARDRYEAHGYDFSDFIDRQIYVLAGMVVANFPAYHNTLNE